MQKLMKPKSSCVRVFAVAKLKNKNNIKNSSIIIEIKNKHKKKYHDKSINGFT